MTVENMERRRRRKRFVARWMATKGPWCPDCGVEMIEGTFPHGPPNNLATADHIVPKSLGGTNALANYRVCCRLCNMKRGNRPLRAPVAVLPGSDPTCDSPPQSEGGACPPQ